MARVMLEFSFKVLFVICISILFRIEPVGTKPKILVASLKPNEVTVSFTLCESFRPKFQVMRKQRFLKKTTSEDI